MTDKIDEKSPINSIARITETQKKALSKLGIGTIRDLLYHFPNRYGDTASIKTIDSLLPKEKAVVFGTIENLKTSKAYNKKIPMAEGTLKDDTGTVKITWFNQPYIAKMIGEGSLVRIEGTVSKRQKSDSLYFSNPEIEKVGSLPQGVGDALFRDKEGVSQDAWRLYPIYQETKGIRSAWIYHTIQKIFKQNILENLEDPLPREILDRYNLPGFKTAMIWMHSPQKESDAKAARKRFAFEEVFFIQVQKQKARREFKKNPAFVIDKDEKDINEFVKRFPFEATRSQKDSIESILSDMRKSHAMSRLLEGDVGSGKTAVAATTAYAAVTTRPLGQTFGTLQVAYMAPTEILARQHFENFITYFEYLGISIGLITGAKCRKFPSKVNPKGWTDISRTQLLKWVGSGEISILIGTHALIQKKVSFKHLAYTIIDEQHRFGVQQRAKLVTRGKNAEQTLNSDGTRKLTKEKDTYSKARTSASVLHSLASIPHLLSMSATPIPRTLALTIYGDLDLSILDEMPKGRKPIITEVVLPTNRQSTYEKIRKELEAGRQAYVICPRIDEPDPAKETAVLAKSAKAEAKRLKRDIFPEYEIEVLHSKMKPAEKESIMNDFADYKTQILVATSVVEVGVNVPNATVIVIEGAERFGLAQLHQLRGRVIRSNHQAYCYVFTENSSKKTVERLKALQTAKNGFELSEFDLKLRGPGSLGIGKQWGISDIAMEALSNLKMVEAARNEATRILEEDEELKKYPLIRKKIEDGKIREFHFE